MHKETSPIPDMHAIVGSHDIVFITLDTLRYDVAQALFEAGELPVLGRFLPATGWEQRHSPATFTYAAHQAFFAGFLPITIVAELTNIGILLAFVVVCVAVIVLRYRRPEIPRTFRLPLMPIVPIIGVGFSLWLVASLPWETWLRFAIWLVIGLAIYFFYSRKHSLLNPNSPRLKTSAAAEVKKPGRRAAP